MPEGPEVLAYSKIILILTSSDVMSIDVTSGRYKRNPIEGLDKIKFPAKVIDVGCKGKFIWIVFDTKTEKNILANTLGLTGHWSIRGYQGDIADTKYTRMKRTILERHERVVIKYKQKNGEHELVYSDMRNFGTLQFIDNKTLQRKLNSLGPSIMTDEFKLKTFKKIIQQAKGSREIGTFLLDQEMISGIGQYIRIESLYLANISVFKKPNELTDDEISRLYYSIRFISGNLTDIRIPAKVRNRLYNFDELKKIKEFYIYERKKDPFGDKVIKDKTYDARGIQYVDFDAK